MRDQARTFKSSPSMPLKEESAMNGRTCNLKRLALDRRRIVNSHYLSCIKLLHFSPSSFIMQNPTIWSVYFCT